MGSICPPCQLLLRPGDQRSLDQMKDLRDSARMNSSEALGETRKQRLRNAAQFAARRLGSRDPAAIPAAEIQLCRRADGSDFVLGEGRSLPGLTWVPLLEPCAHLSKKLNLQSATLPT